MISPQLERLKRIYAYEGLAALVNAVQKINESRGQEYQPSMVRRVISDVEREENS
jgi:hypothetical protein